MKLTFRPLPFAAVLLMSAAPAPTVAEDPPAKEYELKAVFLFNFIKFIDWPGPARTDAPEFITIGILGKDPFGTAVHAIEGKTVHGRKLAVKRFQEPRAIEPCELLFLPAGESGHLASVVQMMKGKPCLIVGESPDFARQGGAIGFFTQDNKLRFEVNVDRAAECGLKVQSQLLKLARVIPGDTAKKG